MLAQALIHPKEDHTLILQMFLNVVVNHLGVILRAYSGQKLLLCLRYPQPLKGILYFRRNILPTAFAGIRRFNVVVDVIEVNLRHVTAPVRHRLAEKNIQRTVAECAHPLRLILAIANLVQHGMAYAFFSPKCKSVGLVETVLCLIGAVDLADDFFFLLRHC